jgi:hypothetical protein
VIGREDRREDRRGTTEKGEREQAKGKEKERGKE